MVSKVGKNLIRANGITDGDGTTDSTLYLDGHTAVIDVRGRDAGSAALLVRGLDRANLPTEVFRVNKDGAFFWSGAPIDVANLGSLTAALAAAPAGAVVNVSANQTVTGTITLTKAVTIRSEVGATITMTTANTPLFDVDASDVALVGLTLIGPRSDPATNQASERAIDATGASAAVPLERLRVEGCTVRGWGEQAIYLKWVDGFRIVGNHVENVWLAGVACECVQRGWIEDNLVEDVVGTPNAYGIYLSRPNSSSLVTEPRSGNVLVARNVIRNVTNWEGLDTHGGVSIHFVDNQVIACKYGIAVTRSNNVSDVEAYAPLYCSVIGNTIASGVSDGTAAAGILIVGANAAGTTVEHALGIRVADNTVVGHGDQATNTSGGIYCRDTRGLTMHGNAFVECSPHAVLLDNDNLAVAIGPNSIVDPWSNSGIAVGVYLLSDRITGVIGGFSAVTASKVATHVLDGGAVRASNLATIDVVLTPFYTNVATRAVLGALSTDALRSDASEAGFFAATPVIQPAAAAQAAAPAGGTGATAGAYDTAANRDAMIATVNAMRTALVNLGLIKGSA